MTGVMVFVIGILVKQYHEFNEFTHISEGYLSDVPFPFNSIGIDLIVISVVLFLVEFYLIEKEKIAS
jgi:hypothetical protein